MRRWCARRIRMRASSRIDARSGEDDAGRARRLHRRRLPRRRAQADPARSGAVDQVRHEAAPARAADAGVHRPAHAAAGRQGAPRRRGGGDGGGRDQARRRWTPPRRSRSTTRSCRSWSHADDAIAARRAACLGRSARTTSPSTRCSATRKHRRGLRAAPTHVVTLRLPYRPRHRRADGAARRARRTTTPRPAATRSMPAAAARCGRSASWPRCSASRRTTLRVLSYDVGGNFGTRNRVFVEFGLVLWAAQQARPAGEIHARRARRRSSPTIRAAISSPRSSWRCDKDGKFLGMRADNISNVGARCVSLSPLEQGLGPDHRLLRHSGGDAARARGLHQHHADPGLSQLRPAGGDLRDRAADRQGGRASSASTASSCGARISSSRRRCPTATPSACSTTAARYEANMDRALEHRRLGRLRSAHARGARSAASCSASASPTTSKSSIGAPKERAEITVRPERRVDVVIGTQPSGPGARDELRPGGRRPASACRSRPSTSSSATPTSSASAAARIPAARCATPHRVRQGACRT